MSFLFVLAVLLHDCAYVHAAASAANTSITQPVSGLPFSNSSILDSVKSSLIVTAIDASGSLAGDTELFWAELNRKDACEVGYGSTSCEVLCYPFSAPHTTAAQCESSVHTHARVSKTASTALWVVCDIESINASEYRVSYDDSVEVSDTYVLSISLLTNGGLYGRYWDNIWFTGVESFTEIASEINKQWGKDTAITAYGTDYISARWQGKIRPPYDETYRFYLYADDGARLWIDKQLIVDGWEQCCNESWGAVNLSSTAFHDMIVEYREIREEAYIELRWSSDSIAKAIVPSTYLYYESEIRDSPFSADPIYIAPGNVSYERTVVEDVSPFVGNTAGENNSVRVTATDAFGHVLDTDTAVFNATSLDGMQSTQQWLGNGVYEITFMALTKTDAQLGQSFAVRLHGQHILHSPYTVYVAPAATAPLNSTLDGAGLSAATAGYAAMFNVTVYDTFGNERESDGDSVLVRFYGAAAGHGHADYVQLGRGVYRVIYTLTKVGTYWPEITVNGVILPYNDSLNVSAGAIHGPSCDIGNAAQLNTTLQVGESEFLVVQSRDQFGNALQSTSDTYVATVATDEESVAVAVHSMGAGQYNVSFTPTQIGSYQVRILLDNTTHIGGSPYALEVIPGDASATKTHVLTSDDDDVYGDGYSAAQSNVESTFVVQLRDEFNNTLTTNSTASFSLSTLQCASMNVSVDCADIGDGRMQCVYTPIQSGACLLRLQIAAVSIVDAPFAVTVAAGPVSAAHCFAYGVQDGVAGDTQTFTVQAQDANGNNVTIGGHTFIASLIDEHGAFDDVYADIVDHIDGTYTANFVTERANVYEAIAVQLRSGGGLLGTYFTDYAFTNVYAGYGEQVIDERIWFDWGYAAPQPSHDVNFPASDYFSVRWTGYLYPPYSETFTIFATIEGGSGVRLSLNGDVIIDEFDPLDGESDPFVIVQLSANTFYDLVLEFREQSGASKLLLEWESASIVPRTAIAGDYLYYEKHIGGSGSGSGQSYANVSIIPATTLASACVLDGDALQTAVAGQNMSISITTMDAYGNIQTHAGNEETLFALYVVTESAARINGTVLHAGSNGSDGQYTASYAVSNASQSHTLHLTLNGVNVASSPFTIAVLPGALSLTQSVAVLSDGRAGELQSFVLYVADAHQNRIDNTEFTIALVLTHAVTSATVTTNNITNLGDGSYRVSYNVTKSGVYVPAITIDGDTLTTITGNITISEAIAAASKSFIRGWQSGAAGSISAGSNVQKTVQLIDIYSNVISVNGGYNFYAVLKNASSSSSSSSIVDHAIATSADNGTYLLNFTAPSAGTYYLHVLLASGDINTADGLTGEYFNNRWLYDTPYVTQIDRNLSLNWYDGLVTPTAKNYVSVRWTGFIRPAYAETYVFTIVSDDGSRLYVNHELIFDEFLSDAGTFNGSYTFATADLLYPIQIEYRENTGNANISLEYESASQSASLVPQNVLFSSASHIKSSPFTLTVV